MDDQRIRLVRAQAELEEEITALVAIHARKNGVSHRRRVARILPLPGLELDQRISALERTIEEVGASV